jgi:trans-aconitate methyltransferase
LGLFGSAAEVYERYRPGYPDQVVTAVMTYAARSIRSALEVGAGTGKATRLFAGRGVHVTAIEPDPAMATVLTRSMKSSPVEIVLATFEDYRPERQFDLLFSAAAWHWTDPTNRWTRAADVLKPAGTLAIFGIPGDLADAELAAAVEMVECRSLSSVSLDRGQEWSVGQLAGMGLFADVDEQRLPAAVECSADDYVGRLATVSSYLQLDQPSRGEALRAVRKVLPKRVVLDETVELVLARRRPVD